MKEFLQLLSADPLSATQTKLLAKLKEMAEKKLEDVLAMKSLEKAWHAEAMFRYGAYLCRSLKPEKASMEDRKQASDLLQASEQLGHQGATGLVSVSCVFV